MKRITISISWPYSAAEVRLLLAFAFRTALVTYFGFLLMDSVRPGTVSVFISLNEFLWVAIVFGIIAYIWPVITIAEGSIHKHNIHSPWLFFLSLCAAIMVWVKFSTHVWVGIPLAVCTGVLIFVLNYFLYSANDG